MSATMLKAISKTIQQIAEATAAVLHLGVTIVDQNLLRIAGTGKYKDFIGYYACKDSAFGEALASGKTIVVETPTLDPYCKACTQKEHCSESAHVCTPIIVDGVVVGVFAVIAWSSEERERLLREEDDYMEFIKRMSELISFKISEQQIYDQLQDMIGHLQEVVNTVNDGIIAVNQRGEILTCNKAAGQLLGFESLEHIQFKKIKLPAQIPIADTLQNGNTLLNKEVFLEKKRQRIYFYTSIFPVWREKNLIGAVVVLKDFNDVKKMVNRFLDSRAKYTFENIIGQSEQIQNSKMLALKAAQSDSNILILGESGTGKELFAHAICNAGPRAKKPFIAVNCGAIPDNMLESELFGYESGAFTGAKKGGKPGKFELADGGTIFLDEIGDLPLRLQVKLLRTLQMGTISRLGGTKDVKVDVRVIAASNKDLEDMVRKKEFREDLYYRLNVIPIYLHSLRERKEDIKYFVDYFLKNYSIELNKKITRIEKEVIEILEEYDWPGNVRELENTIEFAINMASGDTITSNDLPYRLRNITLNKKTEENCAKLKSLQEIEIAMIKKGLKLYGTTDQAKVRIANELGISRSSIYRKIKKYKLL